MTRLDAPSDLVNMPFSTLKQNAISSYYPTYWQNLSVFRSQRWQSREGVRHNGRIEARRTGREEKWGTGREEEWRTGREQERRTG